MRMFGSLFLVFLFQASVSNGADEPQSQWHDVRSQFKTWAESKGRLTSKDRDEFIREHLSGLEISSLGEEELICLSLIVRRSSWDSELLNRLKEFRDHEGLIGAVARCEEALRVINSRDPDEKDRLFVAAVGHPSFAALLLQADPEGFAAQEPPWRTLLFFGGVRDEALAMAAESLVHNAERLMAEHDVEIASRVREYAGRMARLEERLPDEVTARIGAVVRAYADGIADQGQTGANYSQWIGDLATILSSPRLTGRKAPALDIQWDSFGEGLESLEDLEGMVVLIDFWSTSCGPCIGEFPGLRKLQEHYEGYEFIVLGVTGYQGYHVDPEKGLLDCRGDREREQELMLPFMEHHRMNWPVVFTAQPSINPDFGGQAIPHKVLIGPDGVVQSADVDSMWMEVDGQSMPTFDHLHEAIDAMLKEAGLPTPPKKDR